MDLKEILPQLLADTSALEKSIIMSMLNLCEEENADFIFFYESLPEVEGEATTIHCYKRTPELAKGDPSIYMANKIDAFNGLLPNIGAIMMMNGTSEEDTAAFYAFFENILRESYKEHEAVNLLFDREKRAFALSDGQKFWPIEATKFVNLPRIIGAMAGEE